MQVDLLKIKHGICNKETKEYLDELVDKLTDILNNIDDDNISDDIMKKIKGDK